MPRNKEGSNDEEKGKREKGWMGRRTGETRATWRVVVCKRRRRKSDVVVNFCKNGEGRLKKKGRRKSQKDYKCKAGKGEGVWRSENLVGCGGKKNKAEKRSEWVGDREPDRVFSSKATPKHVKSPTTTVSQTWCGHGAEQREENSNAYMLSWMCKLLPKYPSQCLSTYRIVQPTDL